MTDVRPFAPPSPTVAVIGAGPAGLMAAEVAVGGGARVTVYERMPSPARKFLLAGRGGLNLTHSEPLDLFLTRYVDLPAPLRVALASFSPEHLRAWSAALGQPTVVGSSGRVFPAAFKASPLLRAWLRRLDGAGVGFATRQRWTGWSDTGALTFATGEGPREAQADAVVLALGGASWPRLGSDGGWTDLLAAAGVAVTPLEPSNCGVLVDWSAPFRERFPGHPLKGIAVGFGRRTVRGEAVVTATGLEGGALYALSAPVREALATHGQVTLRIALRPELDHATIARRLAAQPPKQSTATRLRKALKLPPVAVALLAEARHAASGAADLATLVNDLPVRLVGTAPLAGAISTAGGIAFTELDEHFMLHRRPGVFVAGEMVDWDAPTGGYLLQACFATGAAAGRGALRWLAREATASRPEAARST